MNCQLSGKKSKAKNKFFWGYVVFLLINKNTLWYYITLSTFKKGGGRRLMVRGWGELLADGKINNVSVLWLVKIWPEGGGRGLSHLTSKLNVVFDNGGRRRAKKKLIFLYKKTFSTFLYLKMLKKVIFEF